MPVHELGKSCKNFIFRRLFYNWKEELVNSLVVPPTYVLKYTMMGQWWPDGGVQFHSELKVSTLLIHGRQDALVSVGEVEFTHQVCAILYNGYLLCSAEC